MLLPGNFTPGLHCCHIPDFKKLLQNLQKWLQISRFFLKIEVLKGSYKEERQQQIQLIMFMII